MLLNDADESAVVRMRRLRYSRIGTPWRTAVSTIGIGIIGSGAIALANHLPGFALCENTRVVALCDSNAQTLAAASQRTGIGATFTDYHELLRRDDVHAVVIVTPNVLHGPITVAAARAG